MTTQTAEDLFLRTAPLGEIIADNNRRRAERPAVRTAQTFNAGTFDAGFFEDLATYAITNILDGDQDGVTDVVVWMCRHLYPEVARGYWQDLKDRIIDLGKAEDGEHPGDVEDPLRYTEQLRAEVEFAANKLAGAASGRKPVGWERTDPADLAEGDWVTVVFRNTRLLSDVYPDYANDGRVTVEIGHDAYVPTLPVVLTDDVTVILTDSSERTAKAGA